MSEDHYLRVADTAGDRGLAIAVVETSRGVYEFTEFLTDRLDTTDVGAYFPHRVTYHPTCHGRALRLADRPTALLRAVRGLDLVELPNVTGCCGFSGTLPLKDTDISVAIGAGKVSHILNTGAEVITAVDNSCLMHIGGLLARTRNGVRAMHLAEILAKPEAVVP